MERTDGAPGEDDAVTDPDETRSAPDLEAQTERSQGSRHSAGQSVDSARAQLQHEGDDDDDDVDPDVGRRAVRQRVKQATVLGLLVLACLIGVLSGLVNAFRQPPRPTVQPSVKGPIDGTYRIDRYRSDGAAHEPDGSASAPAPMNGIVKTEWWAFKSSCPSASCVAVGARLDDTGHGQIAQGNSAEPTRQLLRLVNGQWTSDTPRVPHDCTAGTPGHDIWHVTLQLRQLANGTLTGHEIDLVESNECARAGTVQRTPIVATRVGDVPAGLAPMKAT